MAYDTLHCIHTSLIRFIHYFVGRGGGNGSSGKLPSAEDPIQTNVSFDELLPIFQEQSSGLIQGRVDVLLIETSQGLLEVKAAINGVQRALEENGRRRPLQVQVTLDSSGCMSLGTHIRTAPASLERLPIDIIGLNCSMGTEYVRESIQYLGEIVNLHHAQTFLHNEVPGIHIPDEIHQRNISAAADASAVGLEIAMDLIRSLKEEAAGIYNMPTFNRHDIASQIIEAIHQRSPTMAMMDRIFER
jgi:hypothetical protein